MDLSKIDGCRRECTLKLLFLLNERSSPPPVIDDILIVFVTYIILAPASGLQSRHTEKRCRFNKRTRERRLYRHLTPHKSRQKRRDPLPFEGSSYLLGRSN